VNRGEVWWAKDPAKGRRPHLILTRDTAIPVLRYVLVVPASRTIRGAPTEVLLDEDDGMPERSALLFDNVTVIWKGLLTDRICRLGVDRMAEVCRALRVATAC